MAKVTIVECCAFCHHNTNDVCLLEENAPFSVKDASTKLRISDKCKLPYVDDSILRKADTNYVYHDKIELYENKS